MRKLNITATTSEEPAFLKKDNAVAEAAVQQLLKLHIVTIASVAQHVFRQGSNVEELVALGIKSLKEYFQEYTDDTKLVWHLRQSMLKLIQEKNSTK